jgi:hypothetical protein
MASMVTISDYQNSQYHIEISKSWQYRISLWSIITYTAEGWADLDLDLLFNLIRGDHETY